MQKRDAFFPSAPIGSHCKKQKYAMQKNRRSGTRHTYRKACTGQYTPEASVGMGRKGAIPEPVRVSDFPLDFSSMESTLQHTFVSKL